MIQISELSNRLTLIVEEMGHVESVAYNLVVPGGIQVDNPETIGASLVLAELTSRGAGPHDSRSMMNAFENLGVRHGESAGGDRFGYSGALVGNVLGDALELVRFMVREPRFPEAEIPSIVNVLLQDIASLQDNPARRAGVELSKRYYPEPFNRPGTGDKEGLEKITNEHLQKLWQKYYRPSRAILSIAGNVKAKQVQSLVQELFGDWEGSSDPLPSFTKSNVGERYHIPFDGAQEQIMLAFPSAPFGDEHYYPAKVALSLLSGGMFGRLFIEVREKRGLCYSVFARHSATKEYGTVSAYAGTTPERAHETLDVMIKELKRLPGSIQQDELRRAKANLKSALVMSEESSSARASSNASDWWLLKRVRTLAEVEEAIEKVTATDIDRFIGAYPVEPYTLLTLGAREL